MVAQLSQLLPPHTQSREPPSRATRSLRHLHAARKSSDSALPAQPNGIERNTKHPHGLVPVARYCNSQLRLAQGGQASVKRQPTRSAARGGTPIASSCFVAGQHGHRNHTSRESQAERPLNLLLTVPTAAANAPPTKPPQVPRKKAPRAARIRDRSNLFSDLQAFATLRTPRVSHPPHE